MQKEDCSLPTAYCRLLTTTYSFFILQLRSAHRFSFFTLRFSLSSALLLHLLIPRLGQVIHDLLHMVPLDDEFAFLEASSCRAQGF